MIGTALAAIGLALVLDLALGEPPTSLHPVAWFGRLVGACDRSWSESDRGQRAAGAVVALCAPLLPAAVAAGAVLAVGSVHRIAGVAAAGVVLFLTISLRSLLEHAWTVLAATERDLEAARERVRALVGRDASALSPAELRSAAVESLAENLSDGFVATLLPFALLAPLSPPAAAAAAAWVKGVNTLDSMLGYPSKPIGTASARLDDLAMWLPARATAAAIAVAAVDPRSARRARRWARAPASPNSGWPMAALACALSVRLSKPGAYVLNPDAPLPTTADAARAIRIVGAAAGVAVLAAVGLAGAATLVGSGLEGTEAIGWP